MKNLYSSLSLKIWLPYFVIILLLFAIITIYYPNEQAYVLEKQQKNTLYQIAQSISFSVESAIEKQDYSLVYKSYNSLSEINDLDVVIITQVKDGTEQQFAKFPSDSPSNLEKVKKEKMVCSQCKYESTILKGNVIACSKRAHIDELVNSLNDPAYVIIIIAMLLVIVSYYYLNTVIAKPILQAIHITKEIEQEKFVGDKIIETSDDEIGEMYAALYSLSNSLSKYKKENEQLTAGLEDIIWQKTNALGEAIKNLQNAQKLAKIGSFTYHFQDDSFSSSTIMDEIVGITDNSQKKGSYLIKTVDSRDLENLQKVIKVFLKTKAQVSIDFRIINPKSDKETWITMLLEVGSINESNKVLDFYGTVQDITFRKMAEQELRKLSFVVKNTTNSVIITDTDKRMLWVNEAVTHQTGYSFDELIGKKPTIFQFERTDPKVKEYINQELHKLKPVIAELENIGKNGNAYWLKLFIQPYFDEDGKHIGFMAVEVDITEQVAYKNKIEEINKSLEKKVQERTLELQKSVESLRNFAHIIAHDLKAPARHINVFSSSLKSKVSNKIENEENRILDNLISSSKKMVALIDGLLEFSKIGTQALKIKSVDLNKTVNRLLHLHLSTADQKEKYQVRFDHIPTTVQCDEVLMEQVLSNLISNAIKYSAKKDSPLIEISYYAEKDFHIISVKDNGCGFDMKYSAKLFSMFTRLHGSSEYEGFGIGLANANRIVEKHGGRITYESQPEIGTTFHLFIPINKSIG